MKKLLLLLLLGPMFSFGQLKFLPSSNGEVVEHTYYSLSYLEVHEQAEWVHYKLNSTMLKGEIPRKKNYTIDRKVSTGSAKTSDYTNSGFDGFLETQLFGLKPIPNRLTLTQFEVDILYFKLLIIVQYKLDTPNPLEFLYSL